jgi:hypothetical protein
MIYLLIIFILLNIWVIFEMWKAPLLEEKSEGNWVTIKKEKKISDLFKKKTKKQ